MNHHIVFASLLGLTLASRLAIATPAASSPPAHAEAQAQQAPQYQVYAIRYGTLKDIPSTPSFQAPTPVAKSTPR